MKKNLELFLFFLLVSIPNGIRAEDTEVFADPDVILDKESDLSIVGWNLTESQSYCIYSETPVDFDYAWGCGIPFQEEDQISANSLSGFWSPCKRSSCDIIYRNPTDRSKPMSITLDFFLKGTSRITVTTQGANGAFNKNVDIVTPRDGNRKRIFLDMFPDSVAFKFTLTTSNPGYGVIEKITIDMDVKAELTTPRSSSEPTEGGGVRQASSGSLMLALAFVLAKLSIC